MKYVVLKVFVGSEGRSSNVSRASSTGEIIGHLGRVISKGQSFRKYILEPLQADLTPIALPQLTKRIYIVYRAYRVVRTRIKKN